MQPTYETNNVRKYILLSITVLILIVAIVVTVLSLTPQETVKAPVTNDTAGDTKVDSSDKSKSDHISYTATTEGNALDQLRLINDSVVVQESDLGSYVESINGLTGGTGGKYWSFYVDGQLADTGAGEYKLNGGEMIEWKFQKL